jgi:hypothetical protein
MQGPSTQWQLILEPLLKGHRADLGTSSVMMVQSDGELREGWGTWGLIKEEQIGMEGIHGHNSC